MGESAVSITCLFQHERNQIILWTASFRKDHTFFSVTRANSFMHYFNTSVHSSRRFGYKFFYCYTLQITMSLTDVLFRFTCRPSRSSCQAWLRKWMPRDIHPFLFSSGNQRVLFIFSFFNVFHYSPISKLFDFTLGFYF